MLATNANTELLPPIGSRRPILEMSGISFSYRKKEKVIDGLQLVVGPGEIIGISGENGSGKSTLLKLIIGLLKPQKGVITKRGKISYSPQNVLLFDNLSVWENFLVFGNGMGLKEVVIREKSNEILTKLKFGQYRDHLVRDLSGGTMQKANFGISLLGNPDLLVLDEPYQGMDYASFLGFWAIQKDLRDQGKSIIIVSHLIEDQRKFTRSFQMMDGKLIENGFGSVQPTAVPGE